MGMDPYAYPCRYVRTGVSECILKLEITAEAPTKTELKKWTLKITSFDSVEDE